MGVDPVCSPHINCCRREALAQLHALRGSSSSGGGPTSDSAPPLAFLSHAWGATPPRVKAAALKRFAGLSALGNAAWDVVFGSLMPQVRMPLGGAL